MAPAPMAADQAPEPYEEVTMSVMEAEEPSAPAVAEAVQPKYVVDEARILPSHAYIYEGAANIADTARFKGLTATSAYVSRSISPERLEAVGTIERQPNGDLSAGRGKILKQLTPFPWPPPKPSTKYTFDNQAIGFAKPGTSTLAEVDRAMTKALGQLDYNNRSYFGMLGGFVLVTQIEQIDPQGAPLQGNERWELSLPGRFDFWTKGFWSAVLKGSKGYFRILVLVVTDDEMERPTENADPQQAMDWLTSGGDRLPPHRGKDPYTADHRVIALIYEFERRDIDTEVRGPIRPPGRLPALTHLRRSAIIATLTQPSP